MNPVLLKPQSEIGAQVVVQGKVIGTAKARDYQAHEAEAAAAPCWTASRACRREADLVLVEGAGSASEVNLRANDIANMGFARAADVPVVLIGDIDRGGVIASLVGTKAVLDPDDAALIAGFIVNKFRGDPSAVRRRHGGDRARAPAGRRSGSCRSSPTRGLLPAEDALALDQRRSDAPTARVRDRRADPAAHRQFRRPRSARGRAGRSTWSACDRARRCRATPTSSSCPARRRPSPISRPCARRAWTSTSPRIVRRGGRVLGLCGGYQMLGRDHRRSRRHRRAARHGRRARPARRRDRC